MLPSALSLSMTDSQLSITILLLIYSISPIVSCVISAMILTPPSKLISPIHSSLPPIPPSIICPSHLTHLPWQIVHYLIQFTMHYMSSTSLCQRCRGQNDFGRFLRQETTVRAEGCMGYQVSDPVYVRTYVCMYVCTYVCTYVCMYVCMYVCTYVSM